MKKNRFIVSLVIFFFVLTLGVLFCFLKTKSPLERVIPDGAFVYARFSDLKGDLKKITSTRIWSTLNTLDYNSLVEKGIIKENELASIENIKFFLNHAESNSFLKRFLSQDAAIVIYPVSIDFTKMGPRSPITTSRMMEDVFSRISLVVRIAPDVQLAESLSGFFGQFSKNIILEKTEYKKHTIHLVIFPDSNIRLGIVRHNDLLVAGIGDSAAKASIDVAMGSKPSLQDNPLFKKVKNKSLKKSSVFFYWDIEKFFVMMKENFGFNQTLQDVFKRSAGFQSGGLSARWDQTSPVQSVIFYDAQAMDAKTKEYYESCASKENKTIQFVPENVLFYQWGACFDLAYYWHQLKEELESVETGTEADKATAMVKTIEDKLGLSIEKDIIPAFDDEIGGYFTDLQTQGLFPLPQFLIFVKVKDKGKMETLLNRSLENLPIVLQKEEYLNTGIKYLVLPLGENLQPGFCYLGDYLLFSINRRLLKNSIDVYNQKAASLVNQEDLKTKEFGLKDKNIGTLFFKVDQSIDKFKGFIEWADEQLSLVDQNKEAFLKGSEERLQDVHTEIETKQQELKALQDQKAALPGQDTVENQIQLKEGEIKAAEEKQKELEAIVQGYKQRTWERETRQVILKEIFYPILDSFKSLSSIISKTTAEKESINSILFLKLNE